MAAIVSRLAPGRVPQVFWLAGGAALATAAVLAAPSTELLPAPGSAAAKLLAAAALFAAYVFGFLRPLAALYGLVVLAVLEGAIRKWLVNDIDVFLLKDLLAIGIYAAVLPQLGRRELRRPWWLVAPLFGIVVLALLEAGRSPSLSQAVVGLRSYIVYVPLLWVGPVLLRRTRDALALLYLTLALGVGEAVFAVVQALSQSPTLNKLVSGAAPAAITVRGVSYLRASGTFMQSGTFAAFLAFAVLVAFSFVAVNRTARMYAAGLAAPVFLTWGLVYGAARSLFGATLVALLVLAAVLALQRRFASLVLAPASLAVGFALLFTIVPKIDEGAHALGAWWRERGKVATAFVDPVTKRKVKVYLDRGALAKARAHGARGAVPVAVAGLDANGNKVVVSVQGKQQGGAVGQVAPAGDVAPAPKGASQVTGFLGRSADLNTAGGTDNLWSERVKPQLELIKAQRLGHGTGTMTLGSEYASPSAQIAGESEFSKLAWELGLPGLALYVWFVVAFVVCAFLGLFAARPDERPAAAVGFGITALAPVWACLTFAPDYPIFGIFLYLLGGYAVWFFAARGEEGPVRAYANADRRPSSLPLKAGST